MDVVDARGAPHRARCAAIRRVRAKLRQIEAAVAAGRLAPTLAVEEIAQLLGV